MARQRDDFKDAATRLGPGSSARTRRVVSVSSKHVLYAAPDILSDLAWNRRTCVDEALFLGRLVADISFNLIRSSDIDLGRMTLSRGRGSFKAICNRESTFSVPSLLLP